MRHPTNQTTHNWLSFASLFLVILLDVAGLILVLPVLTPLILQPDSGLLSPSTPALWRDFLYGFSLSLYPLFMFFSTPILGDLSDKFGRKKILLICLVLSGASYLVAAAGVVYKSLSIFLASRAIAGLAAGTQPIATAAVIDFSAPDNKAKNLAWVVFTTSLGLIIGPLIGGFTSEKSIASWFGYDTPFYFAAGVSFINAILLCFTLKESRQVKPEHVIKFTKGFVLFMAAFSGRQFRILSLMYFCFILAWSLYYQTINWFFMMTYHYSAAKLGLFVAFIGLIFAIVTSLVVRVVLRTFASENHVYRFFIFTMAIANIGAAVCHSELSQWLWVILNATSDVICYTVSLTIFSNLANNEAQGWIMGVTGAIGAITWTVGGMIAGPLGYLRIDVPLWTAGLLCLVSFGLMLIYQRDKA
jgi:MFS family permease